MSRIDTSCVGLILVFLSPLSVSEGGTETVADVACLGLIFLNLGFIALDSDVNISLCLLSGHLTAYSLIVVSFLCEDNCIMLRASKPSVSNLVMTVALIEWFM